MGKPQGQMKALDRAFSLIEILANSSGNLPLKTITELADLPKPTVHRILANLEIWGYVEFDANKFYKLGTKLMLLGFKVQEKLEITKVARPFLVELNKLTNETIFLGVIDKGQNLYLDKIDSTHTLRLISRIGSRSCLHSTGLGKSLLTGLNDEEVITILEEHGMPKMTENTITDKEIFLQQLRVAREKGYIIDNIENEEGVRCIASPIKDHNGKVIAALSISGPVQRITDEAIETKLKSNLLKTVAEISLALGYDLRV